MFRAWASMAREAASDRQRLIYEFMKYWQRVKERILMEQVMSALKLGADLRKRGHKAQTGIEVGSGVFVRLPTAPFPGVQMRKEWNSTTGSKRTPLRM